MVVFAAAVVGAVDTAVNVVLLLSGPCLGPDTILGSRGIVARMPVVAGEWPGYKDACWGPAEEDHMLGSVRW